MFSSSLGLCWAALSCLGAYYQPLLLAHSKGPRSQLRYHFLQKALLLPPTPLFSNPVHRSGGLDRVCGMLDWAQWKLEAIGSAATKVEERGQSGDSSLERASQMGWKLAVVDSEKER